MQIQHKVVKKLSVLFYVCFCRSHGPLVFDPRCQQTCCFKACPPAPRKSMCCCYRVLCFVSELARIPIPAPAQAGAPPPRITCVPLNCTANRRRNSSAASGSTNGEPPPSTGSSYSSSPSSNPCLTSSSTRGRLASVVVRDQQADGTHGRVDGRHLCLRCQLGRRQE